MFVCTIGIPSPSSLSNANERGEVSAALDRSQAVAVGRFGDYDVAVVLKLQTLDEFQQHAPNGL